jgi:hypothetical protein
VPEFRAGAPLIENAKKVAAANPEDVLLLSLRYA